MVYSHRDRMVTLGCMPVNEAVPMECLGRFRMRKKSPSALLKQQTSVL